MKKLLCWVLAVLMLAMLAGCGNEPAEPGNPVPGTSANGEKGQEQQPNEDVDVDPDAPITEELVRCHPVTSAADFEYDTENGGIEIVHYLGTDPIVVIPEEIDGLPVTALYQYAFANASPVRGVWLPDTITDLQGGFVNNEVIEVIICEGVVSLSNYSFTNCPALHTVCLGEKLEEIEGGVFFASPALKELHLPATVSYLHEEAFLGCEGVTLISATGSYVESYAAEHGMSFRAE